MPGQETTINEMMEFLQENMATKDDLFSLETRMGERFSHLEQKVGYLEQKVDQNHLELSGQIRLIEIDLKDIKERLTRLEKRTIEDADASVKDVLDLRRRVEALENKVRDLQPA